MKTEIRKNLQPVEKKEIMLKTILGLLKDNNNPEHLKNLEDMIDNPETKKNISDIMKLLKMEDILMKIKEKRLSMRLLGEGFDNQKPIV